MKLNTQRQTRGNAIVMLLILVAIFGGGYWWLVNSAKTSAAEAKAFARETVQRMAFQHDAKFVNSHFASEAQTQYPPSFRERVVYNLREMGVPASDFTLEGDVAFTSRFFQPRGQFRAHLKYPTRTADLDVAVSQPHGWWQIDFLQLTWNEPPAPVVPALAQPAPGQPVPAQPNPAPAVTATPTPPAEL